MRTFRDYVEVNEKILEGYTVTKVTAGINAEDSGMAIELERVIDNVALGIDIFYDPSQEGGETPFMISDEYVKRVFAQKGE